MRVRVEHFGAWVSLDDGTLVALDRTASRRAGIHGDARWSDGASHEPDAPLEAHVAVTSRCPVACDGCYQNASPEGHDVAVEALHTTLDALASAGVFTVAFGGGEPLLREDLGALGEAARARGLIPVVTTSGVGMTPSRAASLRAFAQVNVSHDGVDGAYRSVRGFDASHVADRAIAMLVEAGVNVGVNLVLTRQSMAHVEATAAHVRSLGARELQLLRYKPAGRAASMDYLARRLSPSQSDQLWSLLQSLVATHGDALSVRIDCALVPLLSSQLQDARALSRWGVFGCEAARHLLAVNASGCAAACSFVSAGTEARPLGSLSWSEHFQDDPMLRLYRSAPDAPKEPCLSCGLRSVCRGGCKVVSAHSAQPMDPDPECPRVRAHREHVASVDV